MQNIFELAVSYEQAEHFIFYLFIECRYSSMLVAKLCACVSGYQCQGYERWEKFVDQLADISADISAFSTMSYPAQKNINENPYKPSIIK